MDRDKEGKGFSGLSTLVSEIDNIDHAVTTESAPETTRICCPDGSCTGTIWENGKCGLCGKDEKWSEAESKSATPPLLVETNISGKISGSSGIKWILGIIAVVFVIWLANNDEQNVNQPSYNRSPPQHYNNLQSNPALIKPTPDSDPSKPSAKHIREAQQILTEIGYDPGPIDGLYGRKTEGAVKAFQGDAKLPQHGLIDQETLTFLRMVVEQKKIKLSSQAKAHPPTKQMLPISGSVQVYTIAEREAPFEIKAAQGSHYLVKLVNAHTLATVMTVFVRSGTTVNVDVPLGKYEVRYASGESWYGYEHLFGPETIYSKADKTLSFEIVGDQLRGFTITLYKVSGGNLHTTNIKPSEF